MSDKNNVFPIGFWNYHALGSDVQTPAEAERWAECGITLTISPRFSYASNTVEEMTAMLDACEKNGVRLLVEVVELGYMNAEDEEKYRETFIRAYNDFGHHPATYGFFICDEPGNTHLTELTVRSYKIMKEIAPELHPYVNFLPYWDGIEDEYFDGQPYCEWLDDYIKASNCEMISYDLYAQMTKQEDAISGYFENMKIYSNACVKYGIKMWVSLLGCAFGTTDVPDEEGLFWQLNTAAACGCTGVFWYMFYDGVRQGHSNYRGAAFDENFEKSPTFYKMKHVHRCFHAMHGELFTRLHIEKLFMIHKAYGGIPLFTNEDHEILKAVESANGYSATLSYFTDDNGQRYVCIVNNSMERSGAFNFCFDRTKFHSFKRLAINGTETNTYLVQGEEARASAKPGDIIRSEVWLSNGQLEIFLID